MYVFYFFFNVKLFLEFNFQICTYTKLKIKIKKKIFAVSFTPEFLSFETFGGVVYTLGIFYSYAF